ncbi:MAG TPA: hypothetical protein VED37_02365 [Ktedonobacteraceae bacterium]|nr:hypothetical protein [Ktedonobacteraceae bacterium]
MQNTDPSPIVGVFRDHAKADHAVEELKRAGFREDQITSTVIGMQSAQEEHATEDSRIIIAVKAEGKEKQAFGVLFSNGANNADIPAGMSLIEGKLVNAQGETVSLIPEPTLEATFDKDSYFGEVEVPGLADAPGILDNP